LDALKNSMQKPIGVGKNQPCRVIVLKMAEKSLKGVGAIGWKTRH
jgi:hypothetical protein